MPTVTIRDLPKQTLDALKQRASANHRSLNGEILCITALFYDATLVTANVRHFSRFDGLKLDNWRA